MGVAPKPKIFYAAFWLVLIVVVVPIWIVQYPGLVDYPNHLTTCYILAHYQENPIWQQRYSVSHDPIPNLAIDLIVVPLLRLFPLMISGKLFLSLAAVLYVVGCSEVGRALTGKPSWLALVSAFTFYNSSLLFGFANFIFGLSVFLCAFAFWLRYRNTMSPLRFLICCLLSIAAFFAHLSAVVILAAACVTIALIEFVRDRKILSLIVKVIWLACPVLLMAGFMKSSGSVGKIEWGTLSHKLFSLLEPIRSYNTATDVAVIVILLVCAFVALRGSKVHFTAAAGLVLFALFLITPRDLFTASAVDARYVVPGFLLLLLSIEPRSGRWQKVAIALAFVTMIMRTAKITADWFAISRRSEHVLAMGQVLPQNARIYAVQQGTDVDTKLDRGFMHIIQFWTLWHGAYISSLFASPRQQPLVFRQYPCAGLSERECFTKYDYVWTYDPSASLRNNLMRIAKPAATWDKVILWRVDSGFHNLASRDRQGAVLVRQLRGPHLSTAVMQQAIKHGDDSSDIAE
jgi:hypothetical protein